MGYFFVSFFMSKIIGFDRHQLHFSSLEDVISHDNEVRFIDAFVEKLDLKLLGVNSLSQSEKKKTGRPAFCDKIFLKLYLYAYLNGIRSSRKLEREATLNIELHWLLEACHTDKIDTIVARQVLVNSNKKGTQPNYMVEHFKYDQENDTYTCPQGETLHTTGKWHTKKRDRNISYQFKKYHTNACLTCPVKHLCTGRKDGRREIERSQYAEAVERNKANYEAHPKLYRKRQEINEHIFGTIKRQWNLYSTLR